jgi:hypothetical protein
MNKFVSILAADHARQAAADAYAKVQKAFAPKKEH